MQDIVGISDSVSYVLIKASSPRVTLIDLFIVLGAIGISYLVIKRWRKRRLQRSLLLEQSG